MFNFKTKMLGNKKTEKWSSLRLDLQQFSPQEFVATCYTINCIGTSKGQYITENNDVGSYYFQNLVVNHTHGLLSPSLFKDDDPPTSGYVWTKTKGKSGKVDGTPTPIYYFVVYGIAHLAESYSTTSATS